MLHTGTFELGLWSGNWYVFNANVLVAVFVNYELTSIDRIHAATRAYIGPLAGINILDEKEVEKKLRENEDENDHIKGDVMLFP